MSGDEMFVVEWSEDWGDVVAVHKFRAWCERPIGERNWFTETVWARDEIDAYLRAKRGDTDNREGANT